MKKKLHFTWLLPVLCICFSLIPSAAAEEVKIPSIIVNEDEWYKDSVSPMIERGGVYYIPAEVFTMFGYITMTTPKEENLLLTNLETQKYISILFMEQAAAVNGTVVEGVGVFRDGGVYYIEAESTASSLGISYEYYVSESGGVTLRLYDENRIFELEDLIKAFSGDSGGSLISEDISDEDGSQTDSEITESNYKRIYVFCSTPDDENIYFPARDNLEYYGVNYTMLFRENPGKDSILTALVLGEYGLMLPDYISQENAEGTADKIIEALDGLNGEIKKTSGRITHITLTTGDEELDELLRDGGYFPIVPDYRVNGASYPDGMLEEIKSALVEKEYVTIYLEDCWNSERMAILLSGLTESEEYRVLNLSE